MWERLVQSFVHSWLQPGAVSPVLQAARSASPRDASDQYPVCAVSECTATPKNEGVFVFAFSREQGTVLLCDACFWGFLYDECAEVITWSSSSSLNITPMDKRIVLDPCQDASSAEKFVLDLSLIIRVQFFEQYFVLSLAQAAREVVDEADWPVLAVETYLSPVSWSQVSLRPPRRYTMPAPPQQRRPSTRKTQKPFAHVVALHNVLNARESELEKALEEDDTKCDGQRIGHDLVRKRFEGLRWKDDLMLVSPYSDLIGSGPGVPFEVNKDVLCKALDAGKYGGWSPFAFAAQPTTAQVSGLFAKFSRCFHKPDKSGARKDVYVHKLFFSGSTEHDLASIRTTKTHRTNDAKRRKAKAAKDAVAAEQAQRDAEQARRDAEQAQHKAKQARRKTEAVRQVQLAVPGASHAFASALAFISLGEDDAAAQLDAQNISFEPGQAERTLAEVEQQQAAADDAEYAACVATLEALSQERPTALRNGRALLQELGVQEVESMTDNAVLAAARDVEHIPLYSTREELTEAGTQALIAQNSDELLKLARWEACDSARWKTVWGSQLLNRRTGRFLGWGLGQGDLLAREYAQLSLALEAFFEKNLTKQEKQRFEKHADGMEALVVMGDHLLHCALLSASYPCDLTGEALVKAAWTRERIGARIPPGLQQSGAPLPSARARSPDQGPRRSMRQRTTRRS